MKTLPLVLFVLLAAVAAEAQESYTLPASAGNVVTLNGVITGQNGDNCARYSLVRTCTQAQVCVAAAAPGGASCTATQARSAGVRIYALTFAGREEYVTFGITLPAFLQLVANQQAEDRRAFCESWNIASVATRNAFCTSIGLAAGCNPGC